MRTRTAGLVALAVVPLTFIGAAIGLAAAGGDPEQKREPVGAQRVVDAISERWPAPNPRDTTSGCKADRGATVKGCTARITTDAVTVVELEDVATAQRWTTLLGKTGDTRQAGRFVLSWTAREQAVTSDEARASMVEIAEQQQS